MFNYANKVLHTITNNNIFISDIYVADPQLWNNTGVYE